MIDSGALVNLEILTPSTIRSITEENYHEFLTRIFPQSRTVNLQCGMQVLEGGGHRKFVFIPGFQTCIINNALLIKETMQQLDADDGYLILDWPGIGLNRHIDLNEDIENILYQALDDILKKFDVQILIPTSLACRLVFCRLNDLAERQKKLNVAFVVPAILSGPGDEMISHYFSFFSMLYTRFGIHSYREINNLGFVRWIWNRIICPDVQDNRAVPLENLGKRMSVTPWTPNHFLAMQKCEIPEIPTIPDNVKITFILGEFDRVAQPNEHQKWFISGNIPKQAFKWLACNHMVVMDAPAHVAHIITHALKRDTSKSIRSNAANELVESRIHGCEKKLNISSKCVKTDYLFQHLSLGQCQIINSILTTNHITINETDGIQYNK